MPTIASDRTPVWALSTTPKFFALTGPLLGSAWQPVLWRAEILSPSATTFRWTAGMRWTQVVGGPAVAERTFPDAETQFSATGWTYSEDWVNISNPLFGEPIGRYVEFGVWAVLSTGSVPAYARARVVIDGREG